MSPVWMFEGDRSSTPSASETSSSAGWPAPAAVNEHEARVRKQLSGPASMRRRAVPGDAAIVSAEPTVLPEPEAWSGGA